MLRGEAQGRGDERRLRAFNDQVVFSAGDLARCPRHCVAAAVETSENGHGVVRRAALAVRVREGADLDEALAAHPDPLPPGCQMDTNFILEPPEVCWDLNFTELPPAPRDQRSLV